MASPQSPVHHVRSSPLSPQHVAELAEQKKKGSLGGSFRKALSPAIWKKSSSSRTVTSAGDEPQPAPAPAVVVVEPPAPDFSRTPSSHLKSSPVLVDDKDPFEVAVLAAQAVRNLRMHLSTIKTSETWTYVTLVGVLCWMAFIELITIEGMETSWLGRIRYIGGGRGARLIGIGLALVAMVANALPSRRKRFDYIPMLHTASLKAASTRETREASFKSAEEPTEDTKFMPTIQSTRSAPPPMQAVAKLPFDKRFSLSNAVLGKGQYSVVRKAVDLVSFQDVAVKCMDRTKLTEDDERAVGVEVGILKTLKHPNVIRFLAWVPEVDWHYMVLELCEGGELFDRIVEKEYYTEREARKVAYTLASCLRHLHSRGIIHRDIKPENILLTHKGEDAQIKIADFGFATHVRPEGCLTSCGTPTYVAPEILFARPYGTSVDCWSFGVILYILLAGFPPFSGNGNKNVMLAKIKAGDYEFNPEYWSGVSTEAKALIKGCLQVSAAKRFTMEHVCSNKWFSKLPKLHDEPQLEHTLSQMHLFNAKRKLRACVFYLQLTRFATRARAPWADATRPLQEHQAGHCGEPHWRHCQVRAEDYRGDAQPEQAVGRRIFFILLARSLVIKKTMPLLEN